MRHLVLSLHTAASSEHIARIRYLLDSSLTRCQRYIGRLALRLRRRSICTTLQARSAEGVQKQPS